MMRTAVAFGLSWAAGFLAVFVVYKCGGSQVEINAAGFVVGAAVMFFAYRPGHYDK